MKFCCILTFDQAKHAIPKTAEVAYSVGQLWEEIALTSLKYNIGQGYNPTWRSQADTPAGGYL